MTAFPPTIDKYITAENSQTSFTESKKSRKLHWRACRRNRRLQTGSPMQRTYARFLDAPAAADDRARLTRGVGGIDLAGPPPAAFRVDVLRSGRPAPRPDSVGRSYAYEVAIETEPEEGARKRANARAMRACIGGSGSESKCMCHTSTFFRYASTSERLRDARHPR